MGVFGVLSCPCCPTGGASPSTLLGLVEFDDYGHQERTETSDAAGDLPETLLSQWAAHSTDLLVASPFDVLLALVARLSGVSASPLVTFRVREGGTANVPDGKVILTGDLGGPFGPAKVCFTEAMQGFDEGPCTLIKITVEGSSGDDLAWTLRTSGHHIDLRGTLV